MDDQLITVQDCKNCKYFERQKVVTDENGEKTVILCKYYLQEGIDPFTITWADTYMQEQKVVVKCLKQIKK